MEYFGILTRIERAQRSRRCVLACWQRKFLRECGMASLWWPERRSLATGASLIDSRPTTRQPQSIKRRYTPSTQLHAPSSRARAKNQRQPAIARTPADCQLSAGTGRLLGHGRGERSDDYPAAAINPQKFKGCRNGFGLYISRSTAMVHRFCSTADFLPRIFPHDPEFFPPTGHLSRLSPLPPRVYEDRPGIQGFMGFSFAGKSDGNWPGRVHKTGRCNRDVTACRKTAMADGRYTG